MAFPLNLLNSFWPIASLTITTTGANGPPLPLLPILVTCRLVRPAQRDVGQGRQARGDVRAFSKLVRGTTMHGWGKGGEGESHRRSLRVAKCLCLSTAGVKHNSLPCGPEEGSVDVQGHVCITSCDVLPKAVVDHDDSVSEPPNDSSCALLLGCC